MSEMKSTRKYDGKKLGWLRYGKFVILALVVIIVAFFVLIGVSRVDGESMVPTIKEGHAVGYLRIVGKIKTDDIVYVRMADGQTYIKRVVAVPGDTVEVKNGSLLVNGVENNEFGTTKTHVSAVKYPLTLDENQYFILGDNREISVDSRDFGPVSLSQIKGKILIKF